MKANRWMFATLVAGGALFAARGCIGGFSSSDGSVPDEKLASQFDDLCKIAKGGIEDPVKGVRELGGYLAGHTGDMMKNFGDTVGLIESIKDDDKHDARARTARGTMLAPLAACEETWNEFADAIDGNSEATALVNRAADRLERTWNIIFSGGPGATFRDLPSQLERALGATVR